MSHRSSISGLSNPEPGEPETARSIAKQLDRRITLYTIALWSLHTLSMITIGYATGLTADLGATLARLIAFLWGLTLTFTIYLTIRKIRYSKAWQPFAAAAFACVPAVVLQTIGNEFAFHLFAQAYQDDPSRWLNRGELLFTFLFYFWVFVAWCALYASETNAAIAHEANQALSEAQSAARDAQLQTLRAQVNPHFLFNTLNTISGLVAIGRNRDAELVTQNLSLFFRRSLIDTSHHLVPLEDEVLTQKSYLDIEAIRFSDRLRVTLDIPQDCANLGVPTMILLPLVENAVKHALSQSDDMVTIRLSAHRDADMLFLEVAHLGGSSRASPHDGLGLGLGLRNVRSRLLAAYGERASFQSVQIPNGWRNLIQIPAVPVA